MANWAGNVATYERALAWAEQYRQGDETVVHVELLEQTAVERAAMALDVMWGHLEEVKNVASRLRALGQEEPSGDLEHLAADSQSHFAAVKHALGLE